MLLLLVKNVKEIVIVHQNVIVRKQKQIAIKIVKKIVQKNVIAKKIIAIVKRKNANVIVIKIVIVQKKNVIADAKKVKNVHANAVKIATVTTENVAKRKNSDSLKRNVIARKIAKKKQTATSQNAIVKNIIHNNGGTDNDKQDKNTYW